MSFTVSMEDPPREAEFVTRLPPAIENKQRPGSALTEQERRASRGELAYTFSRLSRTALGSAKKQFESGQALEFTTGTIPPVDPMLVADTTQIRHDTNILDLKELGISEEDIASIESDAAAQIVELYDQLAEHKRQRKEAETAIGENQKSQNETRKAIAAVEELLPTSLGLKHVVDELKEKLAELLEQRDEYIDNANLAAGLATDVLNQIRNIAQVVR